MTDRKAGHKIIEEESDLVNLILGDKVPVLTEGEDSRKWMTYGGPKLPEDLNPLTMCSFIETLPSEGEEDEIRFRVWGCPIKYLQFSGEDIHLNYYHRDSRIVKPEMDGFGQVKSLVNML